jgi:hypothetical protein
MLRDDRIVSSSYFRGARMEAVSRLARDQDYFNGKVLV